jgi:predicted peptidase
MQAQVSYCKKDRTMQPQALTLDKQIVKTVRLDYLLWLPQDYDAAQSWPLILFLHGSGERGNDVRQVLNYGLPKRLADGLGLPAIVIAPQCPADSDWTLHDDALVALLDDLAAEYSIDQNRVYLTGLSMGARETWRLACANPQRFAAVVPICGRRPYGLRSEEDAALISHIPIWVFHGARDQVVPIEESNRLVAALRRYGADVRYTVYPDADHDSWTQAYAEAELYPWLFAQRRGQLRAGNSGEAEK